jgi:hypothetical protein
MLLHAFPSMFVCSPCEFPENCADNMSMILKVLKEVHLLDLYAKKYISCSITMYLILAKND